MTNGKRTAEDKAEDPIACNKSKVWQFQAPQPETPDIGQSNSGGVWPIERRTTTLHERTVAMDKSAKRMDDSTSLPTLAPETKAVGSRYPRESPEEEGGSVKSRISLMSMRGMDEGKPSKSGPVTSVFGPMRSQGTEETDDGVEES